MRVPLYVFIILLITVVTISNAYALAAFNEDIEIQKSNTNSILLINSGGTSGNSFLIIESAGGSANIELRDTGTQIYKWRLTDGVGRLDLIDVTAGQPRMTMTSAGFVGFGTVNPGAEVHVKNIKSRFLLDSTNGAASMTVQSDGGHGEFFFKDVGVKTYKLRLTDNIGRLDLIDVTNGVSRLVLTTDGKFGFGTLSPQEVIDVNGNIRLNGNIVSPGDICIGSCS